eukprot:263967-Hanusia_phi.AAC.1
MCEGETCAAAGSGRERSKHGRERVYMPDAGAVKSDFIIGIELLCQNGANIGEQTHSPPLTLLYPRLKHHVVRCWRLQGSYCPASCCSVGPWE